MTDSSPREIRVSPERSAEAETRQTESLPTASVPDPVTPPPDASAPREAAPPAETPDETPARTAPGTEEAPSAMSVHDGAEASAASRVEAPAPSPSRLEIESIVIESWSGAAPGSGEAPPLTIQATALERDGVERVLLQPGRRTPRPPEAVEAIVDYEDGVAGLTPPPKAPSAPAREGEALRESSARPAEITPETAERGPSAEAPGRTTPTTASSPEAIRRPAGSVELHLALSPREAAGALSGHSPEEPVLLPVTVRGQEIRLELPDGTLMPVELEGAGLPPGAVSVEADTDARRPAGGLTDPLLPGELLLDDAPATFRVEGARVNVRIELLLANASGTRTPNGPETDGVVPGTPHEAAPVADPSPEPPETSRRVRIDAAFQMGVDELVALGRLSRRSGLPGMIEAEIAPRPGSTPGTVLRVDGQSIPLELPEALPVLGSVPATIDLPNALTLTGRLESSPPESSSAGAVADRLSEAGLPDTPAARLAARALRAQGVAVTGNHVESLLRLASGEPPGVRADVYRAGAHLLSEELPLAGPLVRGLARALREPTGVTEALRSAGQELEAAAEALPADAPAAAREAVRDALATLRDAPLSPERDTPAEQPAPWLRSFGSEPFTRAAGEVEHAARTLLEANPDLARIDAALEVLLGAEPGTETPLPPALEALAGSVARPGGEGTAVPAPGPAQPPLAGSSAGGAEIPAGADAADPSGRVLALLRQALRAASPDEAAEEAARLVEEGNRALVRLAAEAFTRAERDTLARDTALTRLADAANHLRDAGERIAAYKAESVAAQRSDPGMLVAEIPIRIGEDAAGGRLQMYFNANRGHRSDGAGDARVVLDLQTTRLGPVAGDLRVHGKEVGLVLFTETREAADWLAAESAALQEAIAKCGYRCAPEFRVDPRQASAPAVVLAEPGASLRSDGRGLDIRA